MTFTDLERIRFAITSLDEVRFAALCNAIVVEMGVRGGVSRVCFRTNLNTSDPDGGIDAACVGADATVSRLVPRRDTDYQYKSGRNQKGVSAIVNDDILGKPRVLEKLNQGHAFVYITAWDRGDEIEEQITNRLRESDVEIEDNQVIFIGKNTLAQWLSTIPALIVRFGGFDGTAGLFDIEAWAGTRGMSNRYVFDEGLRSRVADLRERIQEPGAFVHLVGSAGDGKTRMVLEALLESELRNSVVYAPQASEISFALVSYLLQTQDLKCTLVIDETDSLNADKFANWLYSRPPNLRVVLLGLDAHGPSQLNTLQVDGLNSELLFQIIRSIALAVAEDVARDVAQACAHSPKLAVLIATRIREQPGLVGATILGDGGVQTVLQRYLPIQSGDDKWRALAGTSLLMRLGWLGDAANESTLLFGLITLDPTCARRDVASLHSHYGVAPLAGRYRYVSPDILADYLAAAEISAWTTEHMAAVMRALTPPMADSFTRRARRLSAVPEIAAVVKEVLLGDQGPFRTLTEVERAGTSSLLKRLAGAFPDATIRALSRLIGGATEQELLEATNSRRDLVWALEELLWSADTFPRASKFLLRLALAENESWANNASNTWVETFQSILGRTEAGWQDRVKVLREASSDRSSRSRLLAARAINAALKTGSVSRTGGPPRDVQGMPSEAWRPASAGEWTKALEAYLTLLQPLITDESKEVAQEAAATLGALATGLFQVRKTVVRRWRAIVGQLSGADYDLRAEVLKPVEFAIERWSNRLDELQDGALSEEAPASESKEEELTNIRHRLLVLRQVYEELGGTNDFSTRFRRMIARGYRAPKKGESHQASQLSALNEMREIAEEVIQHPLLMDKEWEWLLNHKGLRRGERWIEILGANDRDRIFEGALEQLSPTSARATMWLSLYDLAYAAATQDQTFIDSRIASLMDSRQYAQAIDLLMRAGYSLRRFENIKAMLLAGTLAVGAVNSLGFGPWASMPGDRAAELLEVALDISKDPAEITQFLSSVLQASPDAAVSLRPQALRILQGAAGAPKSSIDAYEWSSIAIRYAHTDAVEIGKMALLQISVHDWSFHSEVTDLLQSAWEASDKKLFFTAAVAPWLEGDISSNYAVRSALASLPLEEVGKDFLLTWVRDDPGTRAGPLVEVLRAPHNRITELEADILAEFADEGAAAAFYSNFMSGTVVGSLAELMRTKLNKATEWAMDEREAVRDWAQSLIAPLKEDLGRAESREAEDRLF